MVMAVLIVAKTSRGESYNCSTFAELYNLYCVKNVFRMAGELCNKGRLYYLPKSNRYNTKLLIKTSYLLILQHFHGFTSRSRIAIVQKGG